MTWLIGLIIMHFFISVYFTKKIYQTIILSRRQKVLNIALLLLVPFFWASLIFYMLKPQPGSHAIHSKNDISSNGFHESGTAIL